MSHLNIDNLQEKNRESANDDLALISVGTNCLDITFFSLVAMGGRKLAGRK